MLNMNYLLVLSKQFNAPVSTPLDLITETLIEQRDDNVAISCDGGELLVKVDKEFHHTVITDDMLLVRLAEHQGKYLCLGEDNYPSMIHYVQLSGTCCVIMCVM